MDRQQIDIVFTELMNRYRGFFLQQIRLKFEGAEAHDVFQDFSIHLYQVLLQKYSSEVDLFNTKSWLKAVVSNFCISELRKKHKKRKVNLLSGDKTLMMRSNYTDDSYNTDKVQGEPNYFGAMKSILSILNKREALMLKMKYYYGVPSARIARLLNVAHVDVTIGRLKQRIMRRGKIKDFDALLAKMDWLV